MIIDAGGALTRKVFEKFSCNFLKAGRRARVILVASPILVAAIHDWGNSWLTIDPAQDLLGHGFCNLVGTPSGTFYLIRSWELHSVVAGIAYLTDMSDPDNSCASSGGWFLKFGKKLGEIHGIEDYEIDRDGGSA